MKIKQSYFRELLNFYDFEDARKLYVIAFKNYVFRFKNEHLKLYVQILFLKYPKMCIPNIFKFFRENR